MSGALPDKADVHFFLTRSVARTMGINLTNAMTEGHLRSHAYLDMVERCSGCALVEACQAWLARARTRPSNQPPPGCALSDELQRLRKALRTP